MADGNSSRWLTCCRRFGLKEGATPPNWRVLGLACAAGFSSGINLTFVISFLPEMIKTFGYSEEEKGTYVGIVAASAFLGRTLGSIFWGWLTDLNCRRRVLMINLFFEGVFSFLFGFAWNFPIAFVLRLLAGLFNGTVVVTKAILYLVSDNTNQGFSVSVFTMAWGLGVVLGPLCGLLTNLVVDFPFMVASLPCLVICLVVLVSIFLWFQEPKVQRNTEIEISPLENNRAVTDGAENDDNDDEKDTCLKHCPSSTRASQESLPRPQSLGTSASTNPAAVPLMSEQDDPDSTQDPAPTPTAREGSFPQRHQTVDGANHARCSSGDGDGGGGGGDVSHHAAEESERKASPSSSSSSPGAVVVTMSNEEEEGGDGEKASGMVVKTSEEGRLPGVGDAGGGVGGGGVGVKVKEEKDEEHDMGGEENRGKRQSGCFSYSRSSCQMMRTAIQPLRTRDVMHSVALVTVMSFAVSGYEEVYIIFASTHVEYDGLGLSTFDLGLALSGAAFFTLFIQMFLYPYLEFKWKAKKLYFISSLITVIVAQATPVSLMMLAKTTNEGLWTALLLLTLSLRLTILLFSNSSTILINNSVPPMHVGKVNGLCRCCAGIAKFVAPMIGGVMFSWTLRTDWPPLDVSLTFFIFGAVLLVTVIHSHCFLPRHLNHQQK